jgi:hypothetical protein
MSNDGGDDEVFEDLKPLSEVPTNVQQWVIIPNLSPQKYN